jgi:segregation and condensation protein A
MLESYESYRVQLEIFEGPLDLLLYLIRKNEVDIYDIPVGLIVEQYQQYLEIMRTLNLEVAGEFLVMAATLSHIKSKMLLPRTEEEVEEEDPRSELVNRLLEYQKYKEAAGELLSRTVLGREVFVREFSEEGLRRVAEESRVDKLDFEEVDLFQLIDAFSGLIKGSHLEEIKRIVVERVRVVDKISQILERLKDQESVEFASLFSASLTRNELVVTFLALLELIRLQVIKAFQSGNFAPIMLRRAVPLEDDKMKAEYVTSRMFDKEAEGGEGENPVDN